jgi:CheY-like chemotaxis protein
MDSSPNTTCGVPFGRPRALVVEEHQDTRAMLRIILEMKGCEVLEVDEGRQILDLAETLHPDIVVVNVPLRDAETLNAVGQLRQTSSLSETHIVLTSGDGTAAFRNKAIATGCDEFLVKPYDPEELDDILDRSLFTPDKIAHPITHPPVHANPPRHQHHN